jgi:tRNA pseudouridine55 synthase
MERWYLIDKPIGMSSFFVLKVLKKKLDTPKMWHSGTLDPLATWCILVAVGNPYIEDTTKEYEFEVTLCWRSPSFDLWTPVVYLEQKEQDIYQQKFSKEVIQKLLETHFTWNIMQIPPKYSAIRVDGEKAHKRMREGETFELKARPSTIFSIEILNFLFPKLLLKAKVSSGTYVRSIASDIGNMLWCGAFVSALRRTKIANIWVVEAQTLDDFDASKILDESLFFPTWSFIQLPEQDCELLTWGIKVMTSIHASHKSIHFVKNHDTISHVVRYEDHFLYPVRKI